MAERIAAGAGPVAAAALRYFGAVFAAGFALGVLRVGWLVPRLGERAAELLEMPVMLAVIVVVARWVVARCRGRLGVGGLAACGLLALLLLLAAEIGLVLAQGLSIAGYLAARDPVAGAAYAASLLVYAALPAVLAWRESGPGRDGGGP